MDHSIIKLSKTQKEISEFFVSNHISEFEALFKKIRTLFDEIWEDPLGGSNFIETRRNIDQYKRTLSPEKLKSYPEGFCFPITTFFFQLLNKNLTEIAPNFRLLEKYLSKGGILKIIWGDLREVYFQTAIQLGDWYIDVAYDAIDRNKPKVRCAKFCDSGFKDITSIEQYIAIKEQYHEGKMYLNTIFPQLFKVHPFLFVQHNGKLMFDSSKTLYKIVSNNSFQALKGYINSKKYVVLPLDLQSYIQNKLNNCPLPLIQEYATFQPVPIETITQRIPLLADQNDIDIATITKITDAISFLSIGIGLKNNAPKY